MKQMRETRLRLLLSLDAQMRCLFSLPSSFSCSCTIVLIFSCCSFVHGNNTFSSSLTPINRHLYHSSLDLMVEIGELIHRHPHKLAVETFSAGNKGYEAELTVVTYCRDRKNVDDRSKFRILLSFGQHGRELITTELALRILSILGEEEFLPNVDRRSPNSTLDKLVIKVVPIENMNGRKLVEAGDLCERRNGRGVDLNRNWSVDWGKKEKDYDPYEENPGVAPFSEPESQMMRKLAVTFEPHLWINVHSGMEALFMPYDHKNATPQGILSARIKSMLKALNHLHFQDRCMTGSGGGSVGYLAHGTATDYMYDVAKVPMAFTFEIYGDLSASAKDCFRMFNPVDVATFNKVLNDWSATIFTILKVGPWELANSETEKLVANSETEKLVSIEDYLSSGSRYGKNDVEVGVMEIRSYFRMLMLSCVVLVLMVCSRISKSRLLLHRRPLATSIPH